MATPAATTTTVYGYDDGLKVVWALTTADHTGAAIGPETFQHTDICLQGTGTWGGATLALEGSNDGTNYFAVTNTAGSALTLTADGGKQAVERPLYLRPRLSTVGVGATVTVTLALRRNPKGR